MREWLAVVLCGCGFHATPTGVTPADATDAPVDMPADIAIDAPDLPITYVQGTSTSGTTITYTTPETAGDLNIIVMSWVDSPTAHPLTVTDTGVNAYTQLTSMSNGVGQAVYYAPNISAPGTGTTVTVAFDVTPSTLDLRAIEYGNVATANAIDGTTTAIGTGNTPDSGMITTFHTHDMLVGAETSSNGIATTPDTGFTMEMVFDGDGIEDREIYGTGGYHAVVTLDRSTQWLMTIIALKSK